MRLRAFGIVGAKVDVDEAPLEAVGDLRAQTVYVIVVPVDAHDARAVDGGVENFRRLEVSGDEYAGVKSLLGGLRSDGVGEITGRGATDRSEMDSARSGESRGHDAIFEGGGREVNGVILQIKILQSIFWGQILYGYTRMP